MADNIQRSGGQAAGYKFDRGGAPAEFGPYIGEVKNNVDSIRAGRLQVYIEQLSGPNPADTSLWRTVSYIPPFYGLTPQEGSNVGAGSYNQGNPQSYGMWFTPPDIGTKVICFFVAGDPNQGYYIGCVPEVGANHMIPAVGAGKKFVPGSKEEPYLTDVTQAPVSEINTLNPAVVENPRFWDQPKPVHSWVTGVMIQQGLIKDVRRGPITSNSQRESPSTVYGISTPGRPVYHSGVQDADIKGQVESNALKLTDVRVTARRGGHSIVMDDGDLQGYDNLVRIRSSKGHQITMSDDGDFFYIIHANGQTWLEFGSEGTVDVFSTNSVNIRTQGEINLHADKAINMYAGEEINIKSGKTLKMESVDLMELISSNKMNIYSTNAISVQSDGILAVKNATSGGWDGGNSLAFKAGKIDLNGPAPPTPEKAVPLEDVELPDTKFVPNEGWQESDEKIKTIVTRAPTHEPYPYHNKGVDVTVTLAEGSDTTTSATVPPNYSITRSG